MRLHLGALVALAFSTTVVHAADYYNTPYGGLPRPVVAEDPALLPPAPVLAPLPGASAAGWTGFYVGANAGYGGGQNRYALQSESAGRQPYGTLSLHADGFAGGAQVGYNYVLGGGALVGLETDIDGSTINSQSYGSVLGETLSGGSRLNYIGTARGRVGYVFGPVMVFGTGGFAYGGETSSLQVGTAYAGSTTTTHIGYAYGGGFEYAIGQNVTIKTEFLQAMLDTQRLLDVAVGPTRIALTNKPTVNLVRAGVDFHFAAWPAPAPVVARY